MKHLAIRNILGVGSIVGVELVRLPKSKRLIRPLNLVLTDRISHTRQLSPIFQLLFNLLRLSPLKAIVLILMRQRIVPLTEKLTPTDLLLA